MNHTLISQFNYQFPKQDSLMCKLLSRSQKIALQRGPVLIEGETGTGKSVLARYIHDHSSRQKYCPKIHGCGEFNSGTIESSFFGHVKGAFTGALANNEGILSASDGTTLVLDDIDYLSIEHQNILLRFLDDGVFHRVGESEKSIAVDARVICTTNKNLDAFAESGRFLPDLLFRLRKWSLIVPPLRKRQQSIRYFAHYFLAEFQKKCGEFTEPEAAWFFDKPAIDLFSELPWPGNLRQLRHAVDNIALFTDGNKRPISMQACIDILFDEDMPVLFSPIPKKESNHHKLHQILTVTSWNIKMTHRITGLSRTTIYKRIKENGWRQPTGVSNL